MPKHRIVKKNLPNQRQGPPEKFSRDAKSKQSVRRVSSNLLQTIEVRQPLSGDEAVAISALNHFCRRSKKLCPSVALVCR